LTESARQRVVEYMKLTRFENIGSAFTAVYGALSEGGLDLAIFAVLSAVGALAHVFGFVLNDYVDVEVDRLSHELSERPLVKGTISKRSALAISLASVLTSLALTAVFFPSPMVIMVLLVSIVLGAAYNIYGKRFYLSDLLLAGATSGFCLFGALAVSEALSWRSWIVAALIFLQFFFMNAVEGGIKDVEHDSAAGVKTTSIFLGVRFEGGVLLPPRFKALAYSLKTATTALVFIPFFLRLEFWPWQLGVLALMASTALLLTHRILEFDSFDRVLMRTLYLGQELITYFMIPVMLARLSGVGWVILLLVMPLIWYTVSTFLLYGGLWKNAGIL
jgi:4-hydroxybenzoate polyprenyltransferase